MTVSAPVHRPVSAAVRRFGYVIAIAINLAMLYGVNVWPGWRVLPFLTDDTLRVLGLVNLTLVVNLIVNIIYLAQDPPWFKALGDLTTTVVGLASTIRILRVFPFDFAGYAVDWALIVRILLILGVVGSAIAIVVNLAILVRRLR